VAGLGTYWQTLRHLRPVQIYGRARLHLTRARVDHRPAPAVRQTRTGIWVESARRGPSMLGPTTLRFLNQTKDIANGGWDNPTVDKLWRYNLHYFDDLNAIGASTRCEWHRPLMRRWVEENPPGVGTGWEPYPTSLRIVNWIKWSLHGNELPIECVQSLAIQARWLASRLEIHLLGNHILTNAKALVFAGSFFEGAEADAWLGEGLRVLEREIPEQILPDGGHFELSTMYHVLALEDVLDLCNVGATFGDAAAQLLEPSSDWRAQIGPMLNWLAAMSHPDGEISFFNDAAVGIAPSPREIEDYALRLGFGTRAPLAPGITQLAESGYVRLERGQAIVIVDVGPVGPDYLPAHAHADTLSFELSLFGQRVFVNSGTSLYRGGDERVRQRGTAAQNTLVVDGENSSEVWGSFRVARRAHPVGLSIVQTDSIMIRCSHDGYRRLQGSPQHTRTLTLGQNTLLIEDQVTGRIVGAEARLHLHPGVQIEEALPDADGECLVTLRLPHGQRVRVEFEGGLVAQEPTTWHPKFGESVPNTCLVNELRGAIARAHITWRGSR
jgi:uncharacterized heparinase superfamily protein